MLQLWGPHFENYSLEDPPDISHFPTLIKAADGCSKQGNEHFLISLDITKYGWQQFKRSREKRKQRTTSRSIDLFSVPSVTPSLFLVCPH